MKTKAEKRAVLLTRMKKQNEQLARQLGSLQHFTQIAQKNDRAADNTENIPERQRYVERAVLARVKADRSLRKMKETIEKIAELRLDISELW